MNIRELPLPGDPVTPSPEVRPGYPGEAAECAAQVADVIAAVRRLPQVSSGLTDSELTSAARSLATLMQYCEAALVGVTADAIERGAVDRSTAANATQWVGRLSRNEPVPTLLGADASSAGPLVPDPAPLASGTRDSSADGGCASGSNGSVPALGGFEPAHAARIANLAAAVRSPSNHVLAAAVASCAVNTTVAKTALDHVDRFVAVLPAAAEGRPPVRDQVFGYFLLLPPGSGAAAVRELTKRVIAAFDAETLDRSEDTARRHESVTWTNLPEGLVRLVADLSPDHAEQIKHALTALSAPSPGNDCCDDPHHRHSAPAEGAGSASGRSESASRAGDRDERTPAKRRADALIALITAGAAAVDADGEVATSGSAQLVVTLDYRALTGDLAGAGVSESGATITPDTVRELACDAHLIPMVLGSRSEPLDVGRRKRLVEKGLRRAVIQRDKYCTYDGCTRPPAMCQVHHVVAWWQGGDTSLVNSALLCATHHRIVHRDGLTATVTATGVTWHHNRSGVAA